MIYLFLNVWGIKYGYLNLLKQQLYNTAIKLINL